MVVEVVVESIGKYIDYIFELGKKNGEYDKVAYAFRGQKNEKYKLTSSLQRNIEMYLKSMRLTLLQ